MPESNPQKPEETIEDVFDKFCQNWHSGKRPDPDAFLNAHAKYGDELRERIENFLMVAGAFPDPDSEDDDEAAHSDADADKPKSQIMGDFRILREIGRGGMGVVYEAEQLSLNRKVALKVLPIDLSLSDDAVLKFRREAEAGGRQSHPGIVSVYSTGKQDGRYFIAQELVEGGHTLAERLDDLRKENELPIGYFRIAAELITNVADALEHAHNSGVIHRDIKPSNILLTQTEQPKVTDFGLAKMEGALTLSRTGDFSGTPYYMSPEQASGHRNKIDHRTDIYSLGVTLYEALTLKRPFEGETSLDVLKKIIHYEPSDPRKMNPRLPRDLAVICLKAMEKDPNHRYQTMVEFADDIGRFLHGEVILAKPAGLSSMVWKLVKRNPVVSTLSGIALLILVAFIGYVLLWSYPQIKAEKNRTVEALQKAEDEKEKALAAEKDALDAKEEAKSEEETTQAVLDFLVGLFESSSPEESLGADITAKEIFDLGVREITDKFADQPIIRARLLSTMGNVYDSLGLYSEAEPLLEEAIILQRKIFGTTHPETMIVEANLARLYINQGRYDKAESLYLKILENNRLEKIKDDPDTLSLMSNLANLYSNQDRNEEAERLYIEVLENKRRLLGNDHEQTLVSVNNLAGFYRRLGRYDKAESLFREAVDGLRRVKGNDHPDTLRSINSCGALYQCMGRYEEAENFYRESLEGKRRVLGGDHPDTLTSIENLASILNIQDRYHEAEQLYIEALEKRRRIFGDENRYTLVSMTYLANHYSKQAQYDKAESLFREAIEGLKRISGDRDFYTLVAMNNMALLYSNQGRFGEAADLYLEALEGLRCVRGEEHPDTLRTITNLASVYQQQKRFKEAETLWINGLEGLRRVLGDEHPDSIKTMHRLVGFYSTIGRYKEAESLAKKLLEVTPQDDKWYKTRKEGLDKIREKIAQEESTAVGNSKE